MKGRSLNGMTFVSPKCKGLATAQLFFCLFVLSMGEVISLIDCLSPLQKDWPGLWGISLIELRQCNHCHRLFGLPDVTLSFSLMSNLFYPFVFDAVKAKGQSALWQAYQRDVAVVLFPTISHNTDHLLAPVGNLGSLFFSLLPYPPY